MVSVCVYYPNVENMIFVHNNNRLLSTAILLIYDSSSFTLTNFEMNTEDL